MSEHRLLSPKTQPRSSPRWSNTTKLVIGLTFVAIVAGFFLRFSNILMPLLLAFILAYLFYPIIDRIRRWLHLSWRLTVSLIYLILISALIGLLVWGGLALVEQIQSLIKFTQRIINEIPDLILQFSSNIYHIGPFTIDFSETDLLELGNQILGSISPVLNNAGTLVANFASSTATVFGWLLFVIVISYFLLAETEGIPGRMINLQIPGYQVDFQRIGIELSRIWNSFLRGQLTVILITIIIYIPLLGILGVRFFPYLAILAGFARLLPYIGTAIAWTTYGLVAFFQIGNPFGLDPLVYTALVVFVGWLTDIILDNTLVPTVLGEALEVHPAALLVAALIALNFLGVIGLFFAAPVLATIIFFVKYAMRKMFDLDPWEGMTIKQQRGLFPLDKKRLQNIVQQIKKCFTWIQTTVFSRKKNIQPRQDEPD